jgi:cleavage and polyadenylation specificity factor subunit 3
MLYVSLVSLSPFLLTMIPQVLVHGEQTAMGRLRAAMTSRYKERDEDVKIHTPRNLETLNLSFRGERVAKVKSYLASYLDKTIRRC